VAIPTWTRQAVVAVLGALWELIAPARRPRWIALVALAALVSVTEAVSALLVLVVLRAVTDPAAAIALPGLGDLARRLPGFERTELLALAASVVAVSFVVRGSLYLLQSYLQNRAAYAASVDLSTRLLDGYLRLPYAAHLGRQSSQMVRNAHESSTLFSQQVLVPAVGLLSETMLVAAVVVVLVVTSPLATLVAAATIGPVVLILLKRFQPALEAQGQEAQRRTEESLSALQQTLHGIRDVVLSGREEVFSRRFTNVRTALARAYYIRAVLVDVPRVVLETVVIVFVMGFIAVGALRGGDPSGTLAVLGLFTYAVLRVLPSLNRVLFNVNTLRFSSALVTALREDLALLDRAAVVPDDGPAPLPFARELVVDDVWYTFDGSETAVLRGVDLRLRAGESVGIVGPTGSGKSTLVDVLVGLLTPQRGTVAVDGVPLEGPVVRAWQRRTGVVSQAVFLLDDTIRRNIALGVDDDQVDHEAVARAVRLAQLEDVIAALPDGLDTQVGERGLKLSGGQRQRVAIARALYRSPSVLVFDEGTSALDTLTESAVVQALQSVRGHTTLIVVAHRLSTVRECDLVVLLDGGRVLDVGSYDELAARHQIFQAAP
jgi:ABC-type multidrug transport system fused ATPase/permease subunit